MSDVFQEESIRPQRLDEFIGQDELRANLAVYLQSAKDRGRALDHTLLYGSPGLGKTSLAQIMAAELGVNLVTTSGPVLERSGDLAAILTSLSRHDLLFIDEIHRMPVSVEEILYPGMEDFKLDLIIGQGPGARTVKIDLEPFTLVGATTRRGLLSSPLRDRFGAVLNFIRLRIWPGLFCVLPAYSIWRLMKPEPLKLASVHGELRVLPIGCCAGCVISRLWPGRTG